MIKKLYIDNFRCLVNFHLDLSPNQLWLGNNGTGKSSVIDVLSKVQRVLDGDSLDEIFSSNDVTLWQRNRKQSIGMTMTIDGDTYEYTLVIEHSQRQQQCRICKEELTWRDEVFFRFDGNNAHLFRINSNTGNVEEGTQLSADWKRSMIPLIGERRDNEPLVRFRNSVSGWLLVHPMPALAKDLASDENRRLHKHTENFAAWYRHLLQENPTIGFEALTSLKRVLPGLETLRLAEVGDARRLTARFTRESFQHDIAFHQLSDGQRQLVMIYVILYALKHSHAVLLIDEPDNFVSLREIQPWLLELQDVCHDENRQAIIISHHPEVINRMVDGTEILFYRSEAGHILTKTYPTTGGLTAAETMARGWNDE